MLSLLGAAVLTASIGAAAGMLTAQAPLSPKPSLGVCLAVGMTGAVFAGLVLPQTGVPVSTSFERGIGITALGAVIPLAALIGLRKAKIQRNPRLLLCCLAFRVAGVLCLLNGALVMVSMPLARQSAISAMTTTISTIVTAVFAMAALLVFRIANQVSDVGQLVLSEPVAGTDADLMRRLLTSLMIASTAFATIMGLFVVVFVGRIGEGFAIFG